MEKESAPGDLLSLLQHCLSQAVVKERLSSRSRGAAERFDPPQFFQAWFRNCGSAWFFLFKKNLKVTNIQFAELLALVRSHTFRPDGSQVRDLQFVSVAEFNASVQNIVESFRGEQPRLQATLDKVAGLYLDLLRDLVVVDPYYGSCSLFMPPGLLLRVAQLCGLSGYVHSCGKSLFVRNISKATKDEFHNALIAHVGKAKGKTHLIVYGHEDFTDADRHQAEYLRDGLDDVKVFIEKYYVGSEPLVKVLKELTADERLRHKLEIPEPHFFKAETNTSVVTPLATDDSVLWLIVDHGIGDSLGHRGTAKYFVCYEQEAKNENPFHLFDENKPAWIDHTTIPHTLMGAMINLTSPWWPQDLGKLTIADPFVGTGTTWLEALKYPIKRNCSDKSELVQALIEDNLTFFSLDREGLRKMVGDLLEATKIHPEEVLAAPDSRFTTHREGEVFDAYKWALARYVRLCPKQLQHDIIIDDDITSEIHGQNSLLAKLLLYIAIRTHRRHLFGFDRRSKSWHEAFNKETDHLRNQISELIKIRDYQALALFL